MDYLPIFLKVEDRPCLVVGGGKVATRKVALLNRAGAAITVVAPGICDEIRKPIKTERIRDCVYRYC